MAAMFALYPSQTGPTFAQARPSLGGSDIINAPARDGDLAVYEEYREAVRINTIEALELFIARHPDHFLAADARRRLDFNFPPNLTETDCPNQDSVK